MIKPLLWDSSFFGYAVGLIELDTIENIDYNYLKLISKDYRLVYVFCKEELADDRMTLIDEKVTFIKEVNTEYFPLKLNSCKFYNENLSCFDQLLDLAYISGEYSRFRLDVNFVNDEFKNLYREWITKSVKKINAIETLLFCESGILKGFVTLKKKDDNTSEIGLISVCKDEQRKGVGGFLLGDVELLSSQLGFNRIQVATQRNNERAIRFYENNGYVISDIIKVYHIWNK
ncbi:MAG: GNAT family N-acetyltransferase [Bacteroidota bacterium]